MKRALVFGGGGMLGQAVVAHWRQNGQAVLALDRARADITDRERLFYWSESFHPEVVINCAAFTRVDDCESEEEMATLINGAAVSHVAAAAEHVGARLLHVSSDYVFSGEPGDGQATEPIPEDAPTGPASAYGRSKLAGEEAALAYGHALVIRASWLFGPDGPNFVATMLRLAKTHDKLRVVDDQVGRPTYTPFLARALYDLAGRDDLNGVIHYGNRQPVSWYGFAREILGHRIATGQTVLEPCTTEEFPRPAPRPAYSVLDVGRFEQETGRRVESWIHGLAGYLELLGES